MASRHPSRVSTALTPFLVFIALAIGACAATPPKSIDMEGEWAINDELTSEIRLTLPEPKQPGSLLPRGMSVSIGIPVAGSVPVPGLGDDSAERPYEGDPLSSYGRVAAIEIRQGPDLFGVDYGKRRGFLYTPNETIVEEVNEREITTTSGWRGDRYRIRKSADDGSKMSEEFELLNDGQQLKWTVVDHPKGRAKITDIAIYDRVDEQTAE